MTEELEDGITVDARRVLRQLELVGWFEAMSLAALLINLATVHLEGLPTVVGPVHGLLWLSGIVLAWRCSTETRARVLALVPGIGALASARSIKRAGFEDAGPSDLD